MLQDEEDNCIWHWNGDLFLLFILFLGFPWSLEGSGVYILSSLCFPYVILVCCHSWFVLWSFLPYLNLRVELCKTDISSKTDRSGKQWHSFYLLSWLLFETVWRLKTHMSRHCHREVSAHGQKKHSDLIAIIETLHDEVKYDVAKLH